ncbi:MAG: nitroreductase [Proteobacteria bacterium]|nr:MAG: nitroreductase [Pseudomonadota bacterium]
MARHLNDSHARPIDLLLGRHSVGRLDSPGPKGETLERIKKSALRAPDHAALKPWRFIVVDGESRERLGQLFAKAAIRDQPDLSEEKIHQYLSMPKRAPLVIIGVCCYSDHPKVPKSEQLLSAGAAMSYMLAAAQAENFGAIWRTGPMAYHDTVSEGLGLAANEEIVGFLYIGTPSGSPKKIAGIETDRFFSSW